MTHQFYCLLCRCEHEHTYVNRAGNCMLADVWYEAAIESDSMETSGAWEEFARNVIFYEDTFPMTYSVTHDCGCVTTERSPHPKKACYQCMQQRGVDRYDARM